MQRLHRADHAIDAAGSTSAGLNPANAAVAQFTSAGSPNAPSFSGDGKTTVDTGGSNDAQAIAIYDYLSWLEEQVVEALSDVL